MKVVHIITGLNQGGAEAVLFRLVSNAQRDCENVVISMLDEGHYGSRLRDLGIQVYTLGFRRGAIKISGLRKLRKVLKNEQPDVVQTWMYHADFVGGLVAYFSGPFPVIWGVHNLNLDADKSSRNTRLVVRFCALLSWVIPSGIICCAKKTADVHKALGYKSDLLRIIPNGYDVGVFAPDLNERREQRQSWGVVGSLCLLGFVARWDPQKDHSNLFEALALLVRRGIDFRCALVGADMDRSNPELMSLVDRFSLDDYLIINGPSDNVPAVMNALDLHVLSSASEAFPNVVAEAMACGTPCVVTDVGDAALIVGDTGWVARPGNPLSLADGIESALVALEQVGETTLAQRARERIQQQFSIEEMASRYQGVWAENGES